MKISSLCLLLFFGILHPLAAESGDVWEYTLRGQLGTPALYGDASYDRMRDTDIEISLSETIKNLRPILYVEGEMLHESGFGLFLNWQYWDLENSTNVPEDFIRYDGDITQWSYDAMLFYRLGAIRFPFDVYGGVRFWNLSYEATAQDQIGEFDFDESYTWMDPVLGLRMLPGITDSLHYLLQADVAVGGDSETAVSASTGFVVDTSDWVSLSFLYRMMVIEYEEDDSTDFEYDVINHALLFGLNFKL